MRRITATEAARGFSDLLDAVEEGGEGFVIVRRGREVATVQPASQANGKQVKELLRKLPADPDWLEDVAATRRLLEVEERHWPG